MLSILKYNFFIYIHISYGSIVCYCYEKVYKDENIFKNLQTRRDNTGVDFKDVLRSRRYIERMRRTKLGRRSDNATYIRLGQPRTLPYFVCTSVTVTDKVMSQ